MTKKNETAVGTAVGTKKELTKGQAIVAELRKRHSVQAIEEKDYSLSDLFDSKTKEVELDVVGFSSKFVPKYFKTEVDRKTGEQIVTNRGYHTMIYLADGKKTGCFSGSLLEFATYFYEEAKMDPNDRFNKIMFDGSIRINVTKVDLPEKRSTYNFEILDGELNGVERFGRNSGASLALPDSTIPALPEAPDAE